MKEIIIVGASGFGRELLQMIKDINKVESKWIIKGFIDDDLTALENYECDYKILGKISEWQPSENEVFALGIANPVTKEKIANSLLSRNAVFESIIHPRAFIDSFNKVGIGIVMYPGSRIGVNAVVGDYVTLLSSGIGHDACVGDFTTISSYCGISGKVKIGKKVFISSHCVIIPSKKIGDNAFIGAGSIVINNVKPGAKVFGNPAKKIDL